MNSTHFGWRQPIEIVKIVTFILLMSKSIFENRFFNIFMHFGERRNENFTWVLHMRHYYHRWMFEIQTYIQVLVFVNFTSMMNRMNLTMAWPWIVRLCILKCEISVSVPWIWFKWTGSIENLKQVFIYIIELLLMLLL